jgi:hypothetical protein
MWITLALVLLRLPPEPPAPQRGGFVLKVPRSWMLGRERSPCPLRMDSVVAILGPPDLVSASGWLWHWHYDRLGIRLDWECPVVCTCLADGLGPKPMAALWTHSPVWARPAVWLLTARFMPRESLVEASWSAWEFRWHWQCE